MSFVATAIISGTASLITSHKSRKAQKKAAKKAELQANKDEISARKAEVFAETEGEGIGSLGTVSLEVDEDVEENIRATKLGKSTVSI
tara:strand:+ start:5583 stop:5846 length:264 start_codon:yes stop_codon:yes gene_type:complete